MKKIVLSGHIIVPECELDMVRRALPIHVEATRAEEGCIVFEVEENATALGRFDVYEEFQTSAAFEFHQNRVRESDWGTVTKNVVRNYTIDEIEEDNKSEMATPRNPSD